MVQRSAYSAQQAQSARGRPSTACLVSLDPSPTLIKHNVFRAKKAISTLSRRVSAGGALSLLCPVATQTTRPSLTNQERRLIVRRAPTVSFNLSSICSPLISSTGRDISLHAISAARKSGSSQETCVLARASLVQLVMCSISQFSKLMWMTLIRNCLT